MPTPALLLLIATLLPLVSFTILLFIGKRMGTPLSGVLGTLAIGGSFVCSMVALMVWLNPSGQYFDPSRQTMIEWGANKNPINLPYQWVPVGPGIQQDHANFLDIGIYVDSLTIVMFAMITLVATLVHIFS